MHAAGGRTRGAGVGEEWILEDKTKAVTRLHRNHTIYRYLIKNNCILPVVLANMSMTMYYTKT